MDVFPLLEGFDKPLFFAHGCGDAQLHLAVIRRHQDVVGTARHKGLADFSTLCGSDGDVLQVGVLAAQTPRRRHHLHVRGVNASRLRMKE